MTTLELPIAKVTCMEDRAQIERRAELELSPGVHQLTVADVSVLAVERSLRVETIGAKLVDAKLVRCWREQPSGGLEADASQLRKEAHALEQQLKSCADGIARLSSRRELVLKARGDLFREIQETAGAGISTPDQWTQRLSEVARSFDKTDDELRIRIEDQQRLKVRLNEAASALSASEERKPQLQCTLELTVDSPGGKTSLRATYLTPCAVWRPAYRALLLQDSVELQSEAIVWQRTGEPWTDIELLCSTARPTLGTSPPVLTADRISSRPKRAEEKGVEVQIREEVIQTSGAGEVAASATMPGLDDGGESRLLKAPSKVTIPSDGLPHRIPLSSFKTRAILERVCAPGLTAMISLVAKFPNAGSQVLLAGPVDLLRRSGFVGRAQLKFAGQNETISLSFGSEDGLRVMRKSQEKREEARLLTGRKTTTTTVRLFISNASAEATRVVLEERIPVSEVKEVEVQVLPKDSSPGWGAASKDGIARLELDLPAHSQQEATLVWELQAGSRVAGL